MKITLFYCYAHEDKALKDKLAKHLAPLKRLGLIHEWYGGDMRVEKESKKEIDVHFNAANIILLLISSDFVHSEYCYRMMHQSLVRQNAGTARVIPVILRPVVREGMPFDQLQALPVEGEPVISWADPDEAFHLVAQGIRKVIEDLSLNESVRDADITEEVLPF